MERYDVFARRVTVQQEIATDLPLAGTRLTQAAAPNLEDSRWAAVFDEARGDLAAADARGQGVDCELRLLGALVQWRLERIAEREACS
jgi:hypothetical protein